VTSLLSVPFSDPDGGIFEIARAWLLGDIPPRLYVAVASSAWTTGIMVWVVLRAFRHRDLHEDDLRVLIVFAAVLLASAAMSYAYTKHEILSTAGAFYALAAFVALRHAIAYVQVGNRGWARGIVSLTLVAAASIWAFRSVGVHHMMRVQTFKEQTDWARVADTAYQESDWPAERRAAAADLVRRLRQEALQMRVANPYLLPRWMDRWWGE
jgi:hypothetical protein